MEVILPPFVFVAGPVIDKTVDYKLYLNKIGQIQWNQEVVAIKDCSM